LSNSSLHPFFYATNTLLFTPLDIIKSCVLLQLLRKSCATR